MIVYSKDFPLSVRILSYLWTVIAIACYVVFIINEEPILFFIPPFLIVIFSVINYILYRRAKKWATKD